MTIVKLRTMPMGDRNHRTKLTTPSDVHISIIFINIRSLFTFIILSSFVSKYILHLFFPTFDLFHFSSTFRLFEFSWGFAETQVDFWIMFLLFADPSKHFLPAGL